jgi:hypothetical protein
MKNKQTKVPLINGANGRKLYGLCAELFPLKNRWKIDGSAEEYLKMIERYRALDVNSPKAIELLKALTFLSEFNEMSLDNRISEQFKPLVEAKAIYGAYNANTRDAQNVAYSPQSTAEADNLIGSVASPEDAINRLIDLKKESES